MATYKFALLLALADLAVELGDDSGAAMRLGIDAIAEKFVAYYWRQAKPYVTPGSDTCQAEARVLKQNTDRQAAIISAIEQVRAKYEGSIVRAKHDPRSWRALISKVNRTIKDQPLNKLQRVGDRAIEFLYPNSRGDTIELKPGVVFCFRRYHELIHDLVRGAWVRFVRGLPENQRLFGQTADLDEFLFGTVRTSSAAAARPILADLQKGACFYCERALKGAGAGDVDHFVPWSLYPVDLGHNFVLAHSSCNGAKKDRLAAFEHLRTWCTRNESLGNKLGQDFDRNGLVHDLPASVRIAKWAYTQAAAAGLHVWQRDRTLMPLDSGWKDLPLLH